jgi:PAS domain S-box-containing protein
VEDITDRRQAESGRDRSEHLYRTIADSLPGGAVFVVDQDLRYMLANGEALRAVGMTSDQLEGKTIHEALDPDLATLYEPYYRSALAGVPFDYEHLSHGRVFLSRGVPLRDPDGRIYAALAFSQDITERKEAEEVLKKAHDSLEQRVRERTAELEAESERRRYLAKRLVEVLEEDRRDLSMMLHDDIGQIVAGSKMQIDNLKNDLSGIDHDVPARIDPILEALQGIMASLRSRSRQLRPSSLDTLGLAAALRSISTGASTCRIRYHIPEEPDEVRPDLKLAIFRIAQEAVTNALKHADCGEIQLSLVKRDDVLTLMVEDNGRGFSYDEMASSETGQGPLGLLIMRERAVNAGGELRVESAPGKGTTVIAGFPLGGNPDTTEGEP